MDRLSAMVDRIYLIYEAENSRQKEQRKKSAVPNVIPKHKRFNRT